MDDLPRAITMILHLTVLSTAAPVLPIEDASRYNTFPHAIDVIRAVLSASPQQHCSVICITDGVTSPSVSMFKFLNTEAADWGTGVFGINVDRADENTTRVTMTNALTVARQLRKLSWCVTLLVMSENPSFLSAFGEAASSSRLLVGSTRLLVLTQVSLPRLKVLMQRHWTYSMMTAMALNLENNRGEIRYGVYCHLPYTTSGAQVVLLASWSPNDGLRFLTQLRLFPSKFTNFYRSQVNVTALPFPPYWNVIEEKDQTGTTHTRYTGTDYLMIESIAAALNFTLYVLPTANWDEVTLRVEERKSFIATIIYAVFPKRLEHYDYSYMFEYAFHAFTMAKPGLKPQWHSLYYPYTDGVWLFILVVVLIMPVPFLMISREGSVVEGEKDRIHVGSLLQDIIGTLLGQGTSDRLSRSYSTRLLLTSWLVFVFIIDTAYRGNLTAFLTAPKYPSRVETLQQLVTAGARVTMPPYGAIFREFFKESDSLDFKTLGERVDIVPSAFDGILQATMKMQAHMEARRYLALTIAEKFTKADGTTSLYIGRESVFPGLSAWPIPHDAPYKDALDRAIMAVIEGGLYEKWSRDLVNEARQESSKKKREAQRQQMEDGIIPEPSPYHESEITPLTVVHMQGPLLLLVLGLVFAGLSFVLENVVIRCRGKGDRN